MRRVGERRKDSLDTDTGNLALCPPSLPAAHRAGHPARGPPAQPGPHICPELSLPGQPLCRRLRDGVRVGISPL